MAGSDDRHGVPRDRRLRQRREKAARRSPKDRRTAGSATPAVERRRLADRRAGERRSKVDRRSDAGWEPMPIESAEGGCDEGSLVAAAVDARRHARARFSGFAVGAALETAQGEVITGCNVENATYGLTMCAERVALYKALSEGRHAFVRIAVVADTEAPTPPCGSCRQLLWEYCGDIEVVLANLSKVKVRLPLSELLPLPFDAGLLE